MALTQSPHLPTDISQQAQIEALAQQVQELRQFILSVLIYLPIPMPSNTHWYQQFGAYPKFGG